MHIKFLAHGTGSAARAVEYLLAEHDHAGHEREHVEVLRGDPDMIAAVADNLPFVHRYRSAVIAWAPGDNPTPEQISAVVDDFERLSFAGLADSGYSWTVVQHGDGQGVHCHVLIARTELHTGKSFNPAPPGWHHAYDTLRDSHNIANGWARPDDIRRARLVQPPAHHTYTSAAAARAGQAIPDDVRETIADAVADGVRSGAVNTRDDIVAGLRTVGWIVRETKSSISVRDTEQSRPIRLKGALFERGWTREAAVTALAEANQRDAGKATELAERRDAYQHAIARRTAHNQERYPRPAPDLVQPTVPRQRSAADPKTPVDNPRPDTEERHSHEHPSSNSTEQSPDRPDRPAGDPAGSGRQQHSESLGRLERTTRGIAKGSERLSHSSRRLTRTNQSLTTAAGIAHRASSFISSTADRVGAASRKLAGIARRIATPTRPDNSNSFLTQTFPSAKPDLSAAPKSSPANPAADTTTTQRRTRGPKLS